MGGGKFPPVFSNPSFFSMAYKSLKTRSIYITANIACNLRCIYCYEKDKTSASSFDLNQAKQLLSEVLSTKTESGTVIHFHGGEPLLSYLKIRELCEWAWEQDFPEKYHFFATTNGTLVHGEIQNWFRKHKKEFSLGLSLDGTRAMHNANRSNSFDLIDLDFFVKTWPEQGVKSTISPLSIESLAEGVIFMHQIGFQEISANPAEMVDLWSDSKYFDIFRREMAKLSEFYLKNPDIKRCSLFEIDFSLVLKKEHRKWCGVGTDMEAIDVDGSKHPCHLFFESVCGKEKSLEGDKIDFNDVKNCISQKCSTCPAINICPTCYGSNFITRGNIAERDMSLCEFEKIRMAEVAKFDYNRLVNNSIDTSKLSDEEKVILIQRLEGIKVLAPFLGLD